MKQTVGRFFKVVKNAPFVVTLPKRSTTGSAGYDFFAPYRFVVEPKETLIVKTWVKAHVPKGEFLKIVGRSSFGVKRHLDVACSGIIDSDYFGNVKNDGNIEVAFYNRGTEPQHIEAGDRICQGIFIPYMLTDDDEATGDRVGGVGSTGK